MSQESQYKDFKSFQEFYPYYLSQHENGKCRALHFIGSWIVLGIIAAGIISGVYWYLLFIPVAGYGFAFRSPGIWNSVFLDISGRHEASPYILSASDYRQQATDHHLHSHLLTF